MHFVLSTIILDRVTWEWVIAWLINAKWTVFSHIMMRTSYISTRWCWWWWILLVPLAKACMQCSIYNYQPIKSPCKTVGCKSVSIVRVWTFFWSSMTSKDVLFCYFRVFFLFFFYHLKIYVICQCVCWILKSNRIEWVSDCCLTPIQQSFSYIMAKTI